MNARAGGARLAAALLAVAAGAPPASGLSDMAPTTPPGWSYPVVPRVTTNSTWAFAPLGSAALPGNFHGTYWNAAILNQGATTSGNNVQWRVEISGCFTYHSGTLVPLLPGQIDGSINGGGPDSLPGGRHTVRLRVDVQDFEPEENETNNEFARQFIWSGLPLAANAPVRRWGEPRAVSPGYGPWYNAEGFSGTTGANFWYAFAVLAERDGPPEHPLGDYDIRLNTEAPTNVPQAGFGFPVAESFTPPGEIAFVVLDRNEVAAGTYYASALTFYDVPMFECDWPFKWVEFDMDKGLMGPGTNGPYALAANELINLHEVQLAGGQAVRIHVRHLGGNANFGLSVFDGTSGFHDKSATLPGGTSESAPAGEDEWVFVTPPSTDFYGVAVWKETADDLPETLSYRIEVSTLPNLLGSAAPAGWDAPIVPRNDAAAAPGAAALPDSLVGEAVSTRVSWATRNEGAGAAPQPWSTRLYEDDVPRFTTVGASLPAGVTHVALNAGPVGVRGGRHHLRSAADYLGQLAEFDEADNDFVDWFVWTPLALADATPATRAAPPIRNPLGYGPQYSVEGFRALSGTYWTLAGLLPVSAADTYDLRVHLPSTGAKDGFGSYVAWSMDGPGRSALGIVNHNLVTGAHDFGALNWSGGAGNYVIESVGAPFGGTFSGAAPLVLGPFTLAAGHVLAAHEFLNDVVSPADVWISLHALGGTADVGLSVFDGQDSPYYAKYDHVAGANASGAGGDELIPAVSLPGGYYALVVYKEAAADLPADLQYRLIVSAADPVSVPAVAASPVRLELDAPVPSPFTEATTVRFGLPSSGPVRLGVFDVRGRRIATLVDAPLDAGFHARRWSGLDANGRPVGAGVYFLRLESGGSLLTRKVIRRR